MLARPSLSLLASVACVALVGCGGGTSNHSDRSQRGAATAGVTSGAGSGSFGTLPTTPAANAGPTDGDNDGLTDDQEAFFGTDPKNPDTDADGIIDGRDLAPLTGAAAYGPFETRYPTGAVATSQDYRVAGLYGRSKVEKWLGSWSTTYTGTKSTRSSDVTAAAVLKDLGDRNAQSDFVPLSATPRGAVDTIGTHQFKKTVVYSRYTIDYDYRSQQYAVAFRNRLPVEVRDSFGAAHSSRTLPIQVTAGRASTLIVQLSVDQGADRYDDQTTTYTVPALSYQVFDGADLMKAGLVHDDIASASVLNEHAFEARMPLPTPTGAAGARDWTVVVTPVWVTKVGAAPVVVSAMDAGTLRIGAIGHDQTVTQGANTSQHLLAVVNDVRGLAADLRQEAARASFVNGTTQTKTVIQKATPRTTLEWTLSIARTTAAIAKVGIGTLIQSSEHTTWQKSGDLASLLSADDARRYGAILEQLQRVENASLAVIHGYTAVVSAQQGDTIRATLYAARAATEAFLVIGDFEVIRAGAAAAAFATDLYEAMSAFRKGDSLTGGLYVVRASASLLGLLDSKLGSAATALLGAGTSGFQAYQAFRQGDTVLGLVNTARGAGALARFFFQGQTVAGLPVGSVITAALGVIDVGYNIHLATRTNDAILKQRYIEDAIASALDTAIFLIPTVGPVIQAVWQVGWTALTLIFPDLAKHRMFRSPGAFLTFVGTVFFTNEIPSAYAEEAYEGAAKGLIAKVEELQKAGEYVTAIFPTTT